ncbi:MAG TPA: glycosyltransferase [Casimicrobiaceae bacterium]|nr:glycosyltransferase [Casimicrobiaceae bacterium]
MNAPTRNQPCPCGSGLRFKECHGRAELLPAAQNTARETTAPDADREAYRMAQTYRRRGDLAAARTRIVEALDQTGWKSPAYRRFLAAILSDAALRRGPEQVEPGARFAARSRAHRSWDSGAAPRVSVVMPCYRCAHHVAAALRSVFMQTYRAVELVVVDDGSDDGSADAIRRQLSESPFDHRFVAREHRGAAATINAAVALTTGSFICLMNGDDALHEDRLRLMVRAVCATDARWGFSAVECIGPDGDPVDPLRDRYAYDLYCAVGDAPGGRTIGFSLLTQDVGATLGNLFVSRRLFDELGGIGGYRHAHGWDFGLRALQLAEPVWVGDAVYQKRVGRERLEPAALAAFRAEAVEICRRYLAWACTASESVSSLAPCAVNWPIEFPNALLESGLADLVDASTLHSLALASWLAATAPDRARR